MASAERLSSGAYRCRARKVINGKMVCKSFTVRPEDCANDPRKAKNKAELLARNWLDQAEEQMSGSITVEKAIKDYIANRSEELSPPTLADYERMPKYFKDILHLNIYDVTTPMLQKIINDMRKQVNRYGKPLNDRTIKNRIFFLLAVFHYHEYDKKFKLQFPPHVKNNDLLPPEKNEFIKLLNVAETREEKLILMLAGLYTLRRAEICGLKGSDIDWENNTINIHQVRVQNIDKQWNIKWSPKTYDSTRTMLIDKEFMCLFPKDIKSNDFVISLNPNQVTKLFATLRKKANVACRLHDLRKYAASIRDFMPKKYLESDGGWKPGSKIVDDVYNKAFKAERKDYSDRFNKMAKTDYGESLLE